MHKSGQYSQLVLCYLCYLLFTLVLCAIAPLREILKQRNGFEVYR
jgi:hypothetical protein